MNIRSVRKAAHVTQQELAEQIGVNRATLSKYESGQIEPSISQLRKICTALNCHLQDIMSMEEMNGVLHKVVATAIRAEKDIRKERIERFTRNELGLTIIDLFEQLNHEGRSKAVDYMHDLSENPKYQRGTSTKQETPPEGQINPADS